MNITKNNSSSHIPKSKALESTKTGRVKNLFLAMITILLFSTEPCYILQNENIIDKRTQKSFATSNGESIGNESKIAPNRDSGNNAVVDRCFVPLNAKSR